MYNEQHHIFNLKGYKSNFFLLFKENPKLKFDLKAIKNNEERYHHMNRHLMNKAAMIIDVGRLEISNLLIRKINNEAAFLFRFASSVNLKFEINITSFHILMELPKMLQRLIQQQQTHAHRNLKQQQHRRMSVECQLLICKMKINLGEESNKKLQWQMDTLMMEMSEFNLKKLQISNQFKTYQFKLNKNHLKLLVQLVELKLCGFSILTLDADHLSMQSQMRELYLNECSIEVINEHAFDQLVNLEILDLSRNQLASLEDCLGLFSSLRRLKSLDLSENVLEKIKPALFLNQFRLNFLNLASNRLYYIEPNTFESLCQLIHLDLSQNQIERLDEKEAAFAGLVMLKTLYLYNNECAVNIDSSSDVFTKNMPCIERICLRSSDLS